METSATDIAINCRKDVNPEPPPLRASSAAFTIDFGEGRVDLERHKSLVAKYQKRHRQGLSASNLGEKSKASSTATSSSTTPTAPKKLGFSRKSSSSVEGSSYDVSSSEEQRSDRAASVGPTSPLSRKLFNKRERLSLPLKSAPGATERMVQSFTDYDLNNVGINSTTINKTCRGVKQTLKSFVKQLSSPECEMRKLAVEKDENGPGQTIGGGAIVAGDSGGVFVDGTDFDFDRRSDTVSETGTYTIDADIYTNEQKERMSIDSEFSILDPVAGARKVAEYVNQLAELNGNGCEDDSSGGPSSVELRSGNVGGGLYYDDEQAMQNGLEKMEVGGEEEELEAFEGYNSDDNGERVVTGKLELTENRVQHHINPLPIHPPQNNIRAKKPTSLLDQHTSRLKPHLHRKHHNDTTTHTNRTKPKQSTDLPHNRYVTEFPNTKLSPILSPTQQQNDVVMAGCGGDADNLGKTFTKIMFPTSKGRSNVGYGVTGEETGSNVIDQGSVISVTSSGAFRARNDLQRKSSLTKSDIYVEAYTDHQMELRIKQQNTPANTLSANLVHMTSTVTSSSGGAKVSNLPPSIGGKTSPSKIPSPMHGGTFSRPRSRNGNNDCGVLSDSSNSLETESYLKPTQQLLSQLEKRLEASDRLHQQKREQQVWNNDASSYNLVKRPVHVRHNSLVDRNTQISNKLEHFQRKNLCIDQTVAGAVTGEDDSSNGYGVAAMHRVSPYTIAPLTPPTLNQTIVRKVQNSPNNSPIRRSSSFSAKHQQSQQNIVTNRLSGGQAVVSHQMQMQKDLSARNSPMLSGSRGRNTLQKSASTTNIKPLAATGGDGAQTGGRRGSITSNEVIPNNDHYNVSAYHLQQSHHRKIDRSKYGDTESSSEDDVHLHQTLSAAAKCKDITSTRYNRAFSLRRGRLDDNGSAEQQQQQQQHMRCPNTPEMRRKFGGGGAGNERATSVDRKPSTGKHLHDIQSRYLQTTSTNVPATPTITPQHQRNSQVLNRNTRHGSAPPGRRDTGHISDHLMKQTRITSASAGGRNSGGNSPGGHFSRGEPGRFSMGRSGSSGAAGNKPMTNSQKTIRSGSVGVAVSACRDAGVGGSRTKQPGPRSNSSLSSKEVEFANWKRRTCYDPMKAAAEGKKRTELAKKQSGNSMTQSFTEATNQNSCDSSPSHSSSVHRSQSFHGTAGTTITTTATNASHRNMHQHRLLLSSDDEAGEEEDDDDDEDLTLSADEDAAGFSPPTPSPSHQQYPSPWQKEMQRQGSREERELDTCDVTLS